MTPRRLRIPRRLVATLTSFTLVASGLLIVLAVPASALTTRDFTPVFTTNTTGDVTIRGNTLETCLAGSSQAQGGLTCAATQAGGSQQNNNFFMTYVDTDGTTGIGANTFDSSTATVTVPTGATVLYAGLSWGGVTSAGALSGYATLTGVPAPNPSLKTSALFQAPGAAAYSTVTSTTTDTNSGNFQAFADVTSTVRAAGSGVYTVANVQAGTGGGNYAGWSLAVAYSAPTMPARNLVIFTGYNQVGSTTSPLDIPVSGFTTPATGAVKTAVGVVAYEGDKGSTGDGMSVGTTALFNSLNPINDVFNASITDLNVAVTDRNPSYANTLGFDIDRFDATGALANGATSTTIHLTTTGDTYYPGMLTFATNLYASALTATKTVTDVNGGLVNRNDVLSYSITVTNSGGDGAAATVLTDTVPVNTTYVAGSLVVGGAAVTDGSGDDTGDVSAGNITARLGLGATASAGGLLIPTGSSTVTFRVSVNASVPDATVLANTASFSSNNQTTGAGTAGASNTVTTAVVVPPSLTAGVTLTVTGEVGAAYSSGLTVSAGTGTGPFVWSINSGSLPAGLSINPSTGLITGTPTSPGTSTFTVLVTDANNRTASRSQSINVIAGPSVTFTPPSGEIGVAYSAQPTVSGGTGAYTWLVSTGTLPDGLSINPSTGLISGTPTAAGTTNVTVRATDANGVSATKAVSIVIAKATTTVALSAPTSVRFGTAVTVSASVPASAGGTVTFTDVPTTGPQAGTTVTLGSAPLASGTAGVNVTLSAFGVNTITAHYGGDATHAAANSSTRSVEVSAYAGEVLVTEFRGSGPAGAADSYIELYNTGAAVPLAGFVVSTSSGSTSTLPAAAGVLGTRRSYLIADSAFSLGAIATPDFTTTLGTGGIRVVAPDTALTQTDAVGPASGFHLGTGLAELTGTPNGEYAWVRTELGGAAVDTRNNAADFVLVSRAGALIGGVQSTVGSASPTGSTDLFQHNAGLTSTLLDRGSGVSIAPNRVSVTGPPRLLIVRRTITNTSGVTVTAAKVRVSALSELNGPPDPGGPVVGTVARLHVVNPATATSVVPIAGSGSVTVNNLSLDLPATTSGGLNSTLTVPLPPGGLVAGASMNVAFTFLVDTRGTFWFSYDVDATSSTTGNRRRASEPARMSPHVSRSATPGDTGLIR